MCGHCHKLAYRNSRSRNSRKQYQCAIKYRMSRSSLYDDLAAIYVDFTARRYASAVLAVVVCPFVCLSVCVSVCPSVTSRYCVKTATDRITQTKPRDSFLTPKIFSKFERGHPQRGRQMQQGYGKVDEFRQITRCISKKVQVAAR